MTSSPGVGDHTLELVNLGLSTSEGTKTLLRQLACALVLAVTEEFDDTTLVWCESVKRDTKISFYSNFERGEWRGGYKSKEKKKLTQKPP